MHFCEIAKIEQLKRHCETYGIYMVCLFV